MSDTKYDLAVLGAGPGGYVAAIRAAQLGMKTVVVERDRLGGICLNWGCIPTKALLRSAEMLNHFRKAEEFGLAAKEVSFDFPKVIKRSREASDRLVRGVEYLFRKNKIDRVTGTGRIVGKGKLEVQTEKGTELVQAEHIIVATGARPRAIPGIEFDGKKILSSKEAMLLQEPPRSMVIIGAGAIGVEFAYFYNAFGTEVTLVEMMPHILPLEDKEAANTVARAFKKAGIAIHTNTKVTGVKKDRKGVEVGIQSGDKTDTLAADVALVAIGVQANVEGIGLEEVRIATEKGFIKVDEFYRTSAEGFYAIGDVVGPPLLAHVASHEGIICVEAIAGKNPHPLDYESVPSCTYCQPQVASLGLTEEQAKERGLEVQIGKFPFRANGKALALGEVDGFVKLIFDKRYGELLGAHIVGAEATEMLAELGVARTLETTPDEIFHTIHAHPTMSEAVMEAALDAYKRSIHI